MSKEITNEQLFEFMTKMYGEMQEGFREARDERKELKNEIKKTNTKIVHEVMPKLDALFDGYKQTYEKLTVLEKKVNEIDAKVDKHDVEIRVIKEAK